MKSKKNIIWLASYPKSGNTWLRVLLTNYINKNKSEFNINNLITDGIASNRNIFEEITGVDSSELSHDEIDNLRPLVYKYLSDNSKELLYYKIHDANLKINDGRNLIPEEATYKVIYIIRNPLDVAVSLAFHNSTEIDKAVDFICDDRATFSSASKLLSIQLRQIILSWNSHVKSWTENNKPDTLVIRYEDMLSDTCKQFHKIIDFIGLPVDKSALHLAVESSKFDNIKKLEQENGFNEKPVYSKSFFRNGKKEDWLNYLSGFHVERIKDSCKEMMIKFGYL